MILQGQLLLDPNRAPTPGWIRVDDDRIAEVGEGDPPQPPDAGDAGSIISPGFFDAHIHLPQIDSIGCDGLDLFSWLDEVIYPAEERWQESAAAVTQADAAYRRMLRAGTVGYAGYLTSHATGRDAVTRAASRAALRTIAGQVLMDCNAPTALLGHPATDLTPSGDGRVAFSVNPRFAICCSDEMLANAGVRARTEGVFVQTHLAETRFECERAGELFPRDDHYTGVYDRHGLLGPRTLLGHCVHLSQDEWQLIARRDAVVVHCPTANTFLRAGLFDLRAAREAGVRVALGSDVAAGSDVAMPRVARAMIEVAKVRASTIDPDAPVPTPAEVWSLITRGNAETLGFDDAGRIEPGCVADLVLLRVPFEIDRHLIGRLLYTWSDDYVHRCVVNGHLTQPT